MGKLGITAKEAVQKLEEKKVIDLRRQGLLCVRMASKFGAFSCEVPVGAYLEDLGFEIESVSGSKVKVSWSDPVSMQIKVQETREKTEEYRSTVFDRVTEAIESAIEKGEQVATIRVAICGSKTWFDRELERNGFSHDMKFEKYLDEGTEPRILQYMATIYLGDPRYVKETKE